MLHVADLLDDTDDDLPYLGPISPIPAPSVQDLDLVEVQDFQSDDEGFSPPLGLHGPTTARYAPTSGVVLCQLQSGVVLQRTSCYKNTLPNWTSTYIMAADSKYTQLYHDGTSTLDDSSKKTTLACNGTWCSRSASGYFGNRCSPTKCVRVPVISYPQSLTCHDKLNPTSKYEQSVTLNEDLPLQAVGAIFKDDFYQLPPAANVTASSTLRSLVNEEIDSGYRSNTHSPPSDSQPSDEDSRDTDDRVLSRQIDSISENEGPCRPSGMQTYILSRQSEDHILTKQLDSISETEGSLSSADSAELVTGGEEYKHESDTSPTPCAFGLQSVPRGNKEDNVTGRSTLQSRQFKVHQGRYMDRGSSPEDDPMIAQHDQHTHRVPHPSNKFTPQTVASYGDQMPTSRDQYNGQLYTPRNQYRGHPDTPGDPYGDRQNTSRDQYKDWVSSELDQYEEHGQSSRAEHSHHKNHDIFQDTSSIPPVRHTKTVSKEGPRNNHKSVSSRQHTCPTCQKQFTNKSNLQHHQRIHTGEKPYSCQVCGKCFAQQSTLTTHLRTHSGERPFPCPVCERAFSDYSTLIKHKRTHTGHKPYKCDQCDKAFAQSGNLIRHKRAHGSTLTTRA